MLEKMNEMNALYDFYQLLLTEKQRAYFEAYYQQNLSLAEIADAYEISRNAVHVQMKRTEALLYDYEAKLKLLHKHLSRESSIKKIKEKITDACVLAWLRELEALEDE